MGILYLIAGVFFIFYSGLKYKENKKISIINFFIGLYTLIGMVGYILKYPNGWIG